MRQRKEKEDTKENEEAGVDETRQKCRPSVSLIHQARVQETAKILV